MWHSHLCFHYTRLPSHTPSSISSGRHWREKRLCWGVDEFECLARDTFKRGQIFKRKKSAITLQGLSTHRAKDTRHMGRLAISVGVCAVQFTQLGPIYNSESIFFPLGWSAGCFTFRSLTKQEIKRTSNKTTNRAPHITLLSWEAQCEALWGVGVLGLCIPSCDQFLLSPSLLSYDCERIFF